MRRVYVALILLVTVLSMAWYGIGMPLSCYTMEYPTSHLNFLSIHTHQETMSKSMQLNYIPVTAFSYTDSFLDQVYFAWDSRGSVITNHKALTDVTASLDRNCLSFTKEKVY